MQLPFTKKRIFRYFFLIILLLLVVSILYMAKTLDGRQKQLLEVERASLLVDKGQKVFTPKELLNTKGDYQGKLVSVRAQVYQEPIVCEKVVCSQGDKCCGCPESRDLLVQDFRINSQKEGAAESLKIKDLAGSPLCQRSKNSCNYNCSDWQVGAIYDINGIFSYIGGTTGWNHAANLYLKVTGKNLLQVIGFQDNIGRLIDRFSFIIGSFNNGGIYVLP